MEEKQKKGSEGPPYSSEKALQDSSQPLAKESSQERNVQGSSSAL